MTRARVQFRDYDGRVRSGSVVKRPTDTDEHGFELGYYELRHVFGYLDTIEVDPSDIIRELAVAS